MLLNFEAPKKMRDAESHNKMNSSDSGIDGTYVPNMSDEDNERWKSKYVKGKHERIESRKNFSGVNLVVIVYRAEYKNVLEYPKYVSHFNSNIEKLEEYRQEREKWLVESKNVHSEVKISMNGTLHISTAEWNEINQIINESKEYLKGEE